MVMFHSYVSLPEGKVPDPVTQPLSLWSNLQDPFPCRGRSLRSWSSPGNLERFPKCLNGSVSKPWYPCSSHQNSWVKMDVHPIKNGILWYFHRYWSIAKWADFTHLKQGPTWALGLDGAQHLQLCATAPADVAEDRQLLEVLATPPTATAGGGAAGWGWGKNMEKLGKNGGKLGKMEETCMNMY